MSLQSNYPEQFSGPYYLGTSIADGWMPVVERALKQVREVLTAEELAIFHWVQIKEKFVRFACTGMVERYPFHLSDRTGYPIFPLR